MKSVTGSGWWCAALLAVMTGGCASISSPSGLRVTIAAGVDAVAPGSSLTILVTASNVGTRTVTWGAGSSTCQLGVAVRVEGADTFVPRVCTADLRTLMLEPGESRTEAIEWDGRVQRGGDLVLLAPGTYEVRGVAGRAAMSEPRLVEVRPEG